MSHETKTLFSRGSRSFATAVIASYRPPRSSAAFGRIVEKMASSARNSSLSTSSARARAD